MPSMAVVSSFFSNLLHCSLAFDSDIYNRFLSFSSLFCWCQMVRIFGLAVWPLNHMWKYWLSLSVIFFDTCKENVFLMKHFCEERLSYLDSCTLLWTMFLHCTLYIVCLSKNISKQLISKGLELLFFYFIHIYIYIYIFGKYIYVNKLAPISTRHSYKCRS